MSMFFFFVKRKAAYGGESRDGSSDVCSPDVFFFFFFFFNSIQSSQLLTSQLQIILSPQISTIINFYQHSYCKFKRSILANPLKVTTQINTFITIYQRQVRIITTTQAIYSTNENAESKYEKCDHGTIVPLPPTVMLLNNRLTPNIRNARIIGKKQHQQRMLKPITVNFSNYYQHNTRSQKHVYNITISIICYIRFFDIDHCENKFMYTCFIIENTFQVMFYVIVEKKYQIGQGSEVKKFNFVAKKCRYNCTKLLNSFSLYSRIRMQHTPSGPYVVKKYVICK
eukprot:TRINITY_DN15257_c0_g1_i7.p2 TRINITY_DN15257_c0_g1~~TRINITY_DN15257_c0_g1_i7.p2  ORF type:complete len:292 (+),score=-13.79 TRINITY_DN15257_c0_g1_i7:30-878(+)